MERLVLNAESKKATKHAALIEVDNGSLDLIGGVIQYPNYTLALVPPALLRVSNGRLRVHDCQLLGPTTAPTRNYRGLIQLEGKDVALDEAPICAISDSVLVSAVTAIQLSGASARLRCTNSVILADGTALLVQPQPATVADGHLLILFEHCTLAARRAVVQLQDDPKRGATALPVVVQSLASAYLQPFADKGGLLRVDGQALPRGVVLWQSDKDLYDRRLHFAYQIGETVSDKPQPASEWSRLWGPGIRQPVVDRVFQRTFMGDKWPYDALVVPPAKGTLVISQRPDVGADLFQLGLVKK